MVEKLIILMSGCLILILGCSKNEDSINNKLRGTWIESELKTDTIKFQNQFSFLWLYRGTEFVNGYDLPKTGTGPYDYTLKEDSIRLNPAFSSAFQYRSYYFHIEDDQLTIGNFYDDSLEKNVLNFTKIE